jgi:DNA-binding NarL/FixJ family response regulator
MALPTGALQTILFTDLEASNPDALSEREVEVLGLVAAGMTNAEIAAQLVIAPGTAARHVSNILNKIGLSNRTQAATYATKHGLDRG